MNQIKQYYEGLIAKDFDENLALLRTAAVFATSPNQVKRALKRTPAPRVRKPQPKHK
jgi:AraC-like DNA-binding protein